MIGEFIYYQYLPTLNIDLLKSNHVINVNDEETAEYERLHDIYWSTCQKPELKSENHIAFKTMRTYCRNLERKYLPNTLECGIPVDLSNIKNLNNVKLGIRESLWNCDICTYNIDIDKIIITKTPEGYYYKTNVTLGLDTKE